MTPVIVLQISFISQERTGLSGFPHFEKRIFNGNQAQEKENLIEWMAKLKRSENEECREPYTPKHCPPGMNEDKKKKEKYGESKQQVKPYKLPKHFRRIRVDEPSQRTCKDKKEKKMENVPFRRRMMLHSFIIRLGKCDTMPIDEH